MVRVAAAERLGQCSKPGCTNRNTHRHHKGCETIFIRGFRRRYREKRYRELVTNYHAFRVQDTVEICAEHHEEIHELYLAVITAAKIAAAFEPWRSWTWGEADTLMGALRKYCDAWLQSATPGKPLRKFAFQKGVAPTSALHKTNGSTK